MKRVLVITVAVIAIITAAAIMLVPRFLPDSSGALGLPTAHAPLAFDDTSTPEARAFAEAAMDQVGVTVGYDAAYVQLDYPGGDVPAETGVCTDVVVRALRDRGTDLQVEVHEDMLAAFDEYPDRWGLEAPDANIDHRRVPNLQTYLERRDLDIPVSRAGSDYMPGDIVTWKIAGRPHIGIVSTQVAPDGTRFCIVHNVGRGTVVQDCLFSYEITGHYRWFR